MTLMFFCRQWGKRGSGYHSPVRPSASDLRVRAQDFVDSVVVGSVDLRSVPLRCDQGTRRCARWILRRV